MYCSMPGLPVHHRLPELTQTYVHWVGDAIQLSHSLSSPSSPALNLSQHQSLFKWVSSSHQMTKVLALQIQYPFFQWKLRDDCFRMTDLVSLLSKGLSRVFSSTSIQKYKFFNAQPSLWFNSHILKWLLEKPLFWLGGPLSAKWYLWFSIHYLRLSQLFFQGANVF